MNLRALICSSPTPVSQSLRAVRIASGRDGFGAWLTCNQLIISTTIFTRLNVSSIVL